jgi:hypothetical protein
MKEALESLLTLAGLRRPIWRIGIEGGLDGSNTIEMVRDHYGVRDSKILALCHPHGAWLDWR